MSEEEAGLTEEQLKEQKLEAARKKVSFGCDLNMLFGRHQILT